MRRGRGAGYWTIQRINLIPLGGCSAQKPEWAESSKNNSTLFLVRIFCFSSIHPVVGVFAFYLHFYGFSYYPISAQQQSSSSSHPQGDEMGVKGEERNT